VTTRAETTVAALARGSRLDRWRRIVLASVKQSKRAVVPEIRGPLTLEALLDDHHHGLSIMLVEPSKGVPTEPLGTLARECQPADAMLLVGPEGGWVDQEVELARNRGVRLMTLGQRTLRADAIPVAAISVLQFIWGDL
jgi:16S rRNA (uracil1498-N3)-methyltransferase